MMENIRILIYTVVIAVVILALALSIVPDGNIKRNIKFVSGIVLVSIVFSAVKLFEPADFYLETVKSSSYASSLFKEVDSVNDSLNRTIIEEECRAYILDKALELGLNMREVRVLAEWNTAGYWYPYKVNLSSDTASEDLEFSIRANLGIKKENILWGTNDEST